MTWTGVELATLGAEGQWQTNRATQPNPPGIGEVNNFEADRAVGVRGGSSQAAPTEVKGFSIILYARNPWVAEAHTEWHAGSSSLPMTNPREDTHIGRLPLQNRTTTSRIINQKPGMSAARSVSTRMVRRRLQQRGLSDTISSFQMSPETTRSFLMAVYVSGGSEESARHLLGFSIGIEVL
ncbi:hypothetical protein TNCV_2804391 [Trichonephila clavipes]|nr:hypothetical protein TNCV_2804391 [Trichonephila clavipes]